MTAKTSSERRGSGLAGQCALVTGASRGIGRAIALELAGAGCRIAVNYRSNAPQAERTVEEALARGAAQAVAFQADVGDAAQASDLVAQVSARLGGIDILVNNAGMQRSSTLVKMSDADWHEVMAVNLHAVFYLCRAVLPGMLERQGGQVLNIASASSYVAQRGACSYVASKHALIGLTKALALEVASKGVRVNALAPGLTETDLVEQLSPEQRGALLQLVPLRRLAEPQEIARLALWVLEQGTYSTGNVFHASGGVVMG